MSNEEPEMEYSELSGEFTEDGITVLVDISRPLGTNRDWTMMVITEDEDVTEWDEGFATDREAFDEFLATVAAEGMRSFFSAEDEAPSLQ